MTVLEILKVKAKSLLFTGSAKDNADLLEVIKLIEKLEKK